MEEKYINFYKKFILQTKTLNNGRVILNSDLKGDNYGRVGSNGFCVWNGRSGCTSASRKTYKDFKRKRDSRRQLQGRVNHCLETLSDGGMILSVPL